MKTAPSACQRCGAKPRDQARFCDACGAALSGPDHLTEYKQVTILFADVVRSMDIAEALGAERLRELMTDLIQRSGVVVQRYGGTMNQFTGDGFMALFGAPHAMEDHALRACLAALDVQAQARALAAEVYPRDRIALQLRIGLNSGEVVVGDIDSGPMKYTVSGQQVGMAQRMESVAEPGGVMLSESTARLVEDQTALGESRSVNIKGVADPVTARPLLAVDTQHQRAAKSESRLVGRDREMAAVREALHAAMGGRGGVVTVVGPPGIGKSRLIRESTTIAKTLGAEVFYTYCESHTRDVSFHVIARTLRAAMGLTGLSSEQARAQLRSRLADHDEQDISLLDDLLGIRDPDAALVEVGPDARRRRIVEILNTGAVARRTPAVYVVEDVHWIDAVSEGLLAELAAALPRTRSSMLVTYRPEYRGALAAVANMGTITLVPLDDSQSSELTVELLGGDPSVRALAGLVTDRAAGVPFFAEEIVRDFAERGVLQGAGGAYRCVTAVEDIHVPATLQAAIGARIDRLDEPAKRTLHAAAVIGARFSADLLGKLTPAAATAGLIDGELIVAVSAGPPAEYAFRHPLIQQVAYHSQLRSEREKLHRRLATVIDPIDENAALIATHWEAAGDFREAFEWHMRAGSWFDNRDHRAALTSWQRARAVADRLPGDDPARLSMRIAPRTLICATTFRVGGGPADTGFDELQRLTSEAGDKTSLAIGMAGHLTTLAFMSHHREASRMASELVTLVEAIGDDVMTVGLLPAAAQVKYESGEVAECLRFAERVIELARGDEKMGNIIIASPLGWAHALRGTAKMCLGRTGWLADLDRALEIAVRFDIGTMCNGALYKHVLAFQCESVVPDQTDVDRTAEWLEAADTSDDTTAITLVRLIRGITLIHAAPQYREDGVNLLVEVYDRLSRLSSALRRFADIELAAHRARSGDLDGAIALAQSTVDEQFETGEMISRGAATTVLVEALLRRGLADDLAAAQQAIDRLAAVPTDPGYLMHELPLLRLNAMTARARGDEPGHRRFLARFRMRAQEAEFEASVTHLALSLRAPSGRLGPRRTTRG
ncbi:ATP-binding protein [Mycolicibacterium celeriflavum]|uniref:Cyclase n=1 Tax=Mycolicibacterium celeriflavum TaxID=1249101 RepID=A0A1X0BTA8_MYCCF|nr:adenylate/guanylate cyclase domain-containing protein [Mycolicibacterium celeriflavum]ORA46991.1 guanylate cyclase [Mycolicibacterium celeriflavum]BBY44585.1 cyclase [Mycolicibacterium celeriflavum]